MSDSKLWVVLELTSKAEGEDPDIVRASIMHHIRDAEVFIPASVVEKAGGLSSGTVREYQYLVDGYAFVRYTHPDNIYSRLEDTKYVQGALKFPTGFKKEKKLSTVTEAEIAKLKSQIVVEVEQGIEVGDRVMITSGPYKHISAEVKEEIPEQDSVMVYVKLRSTDRLLTLPRAFLKLETKSPVSAYRERFTRIDRWTTTALGLLALDERAIKTCEVVHRQLKRLTRAGRMESTLRGIASIPPLAPLKELRKRHKLLSKGYRALQRIVVSSTPTPSMYGVLDKQREYDTLASLCNRFRASYEQIERMQPKNMNILNLVIDGTQLMIRCGEAPGLSSLTDSQGRATGAVVGFLRALASYRKRFPSAKITVCWDGSSQRRKAMYPEYKGTRQSRSGTPFFGWDWMKELLPLLGVTQAYHPQEEADDVMASLVRGPMSLQSNVMVTTDKDLLQVVSDSTYQLSPAVGAGKEKLYDPALVQLEFGVPPSNMVQLRALSGDTSDNLPGVPGFGVKTASKVLVAYGSIQTLLGSNLAGMGKAQAVNLRKHAKQVQLNLEVMALQDVQYTEVKPEPNLTKAADMISQIDMKAEPIVTVFK